MAPETHRQGSTRRGAAGRARPPAPVVPLRPGRCSRRGRNEASSARDAHPSAKLPRASNRPDDAA